jgi:hypothetical protein
MTSSKRQFIVAKRGAVAAASVLAACAGSLAQLSPASALPRSAAAARPAHTGELIYVASQAGCTIGPCRSMVSVYAYPRGKNRGQWLGAANSVTQGACSSRAGSVFVLTFNLSLNSGEILKFAHGGLTPIGTLPVPVNGEYPISCSTDPTTGNLAVVVAARSSNGALLVYPGASGTPQAFADPNLVLYSVGYDGNGNAFVSGDGLAELPRGGNSFKKVTLEHHPHPSGVVQWDGADVTLTDLDGNIDRFSIEGRTGKEVGVTSLGLPSATYCCRAVAFQAGVVIGSYQTGVACPSQFYCPGGVGVWDYPAGGPAFASIGKNLVTPYAVISLSP